jgi:predicted enzyme related to lactoylglutathione lyase
MKHQIVHLEIPADDMKRAQAFYGELFSWHFSNPPGFEDYWGDDVGRTPATGLG